MVFILSFFYQYHVYNTNFRSVGVATGLTLASIFQTSGRYLDLPRNTEITYDRALREIGSNMIFGAYAAERFKTSDSSCENDAVLKQLFDEYQGNFTVIHVLQFTLYSL